VTFANALSFSSSLSVTLTSVISTQTSLRSFPENYPPAGQLPLSIHTS
jgi:hypothetical protein